MGAAAFNERRRVLTGIAEFNAHRAWSKTPPAGSLLNLLKPAVLKLPLLYDILALLPLPAFAKRYSRSTKLLSPWACRRGARRGGACQ